MQLRGLPYDLTKEGILQFFEGFKVVQESVVLGIDSRKHFTGTAVIGFENEVERRRAYETKRGKYIGTRYVELFLLSPKGYERFAHTY